MVWQTIKLASPLAAEPFGCGPGAGEGVLGGMVDDHVGGRGREGKGGEMERGSGPRSSPGGLGSIILIKNF